MIAEHSISSTPSVSTYIINDQAVVVCPYCGFAHYHGVGADGLGTGTRLSECLDMHARGIYRLEPQYGVPPRAVLRAMKRTGLPRGRPPRWPR